LNNKGLEIAKIIDLLNKQNIYWTKHCLNRLQQRNIKIDDVKNAIKTGKIIEYYYDDYPNPSCLILGYSKEHSFLHVVCGINNEYLFIITAYYPDSNQWDEKMEKRRNN